jgi:hypothetical protein
LRPTLVILAGFALVSLLLAWSRALAHRRWAAAGHVLLALLTAGIAAAGWPVVSNVETYSVRHADSAIADLFVEQTAAERYRVTITRLPGGRMQVFDLDGDEWRLVVHTLDWTDYPSAIGLAPRYRIERLEARADGTATGAGSSFGLADSPGPDLWELAATGGTWTRLVTPGNPDSDWQPLADGARYSVRLRGGRVVVEALNDPATAVLEARR